MDDIHLSISWEKGIILSTEEEQICFDPQRRASEFDNVFISHSHSDHTAGFSGRSEKYSTIETKQIFEARYGKDIESFRRIRYDKKIEIGSVEIIPRNAGHILGSTQFEIHTDQKTIVYTGDINCKHTLITEAAKPINCDILILEATYGNPVFQFPARDGIYVEIAEWVLRSIKGRRTPVFEVYSVGKAQEIIAVINYFTELPVVVSPIISRVNEVYERFNKRLDSIRADSGEGEEVLKEGECCYVISSRKRNLPDNAVKATATGWNVRFGPRRYGTGFLLSNHADFKQLIKYVEEAKPSIVYTCYGQDKTLLPAYITRKTGISALPLEKIGHTTVSKRGDNNTPLAEKLLDFVVIPGFVYSRKWIFRKMTTLGVDEEATERALDYLEKKEVISFEQDLKGYRLT